MSACTIVGPYLPVGDDEWMCRTHGVEAVLNDPSKAGTHPILRQDLRCPKEKRSE